MSLSEKDLALIKRALKWYDTDKLIREVGESALAALLAAAREEPRPPQEGAEPVAWTGRTHDLKTWPTPYDAVAAGLKPWELRLNDRDYRVGDRLRLRRWVPVAESYSGEETTRQVAWLLKGPAFGLPEGYVIMSLSPPDPQARIEALEAENADLKSSVIAFCAPWAVAYARDHGLPEGHLSPGHYDLLKACGARMVDFTRGGPG